MTVKQYPEDEFDTLANKRTLRGSHRRRRHPLVTVAPLIAALILAPVAGWALVEVMSEDGLVNPFATDEATMIETEEPVADPSGDGSTDVNDEPATATTDEPTDEPSDESADPIETLPPVDGVAYDATINLYDGTGLESGAEPAESALLSAGYTNIDGDEYGAVDPADSVIYFASPDLYATAQNISRTLNIDFWAENSAMAEDVDIVIIVR